MSKDVILRVTTLAICGMLCCSALWAQETAAPEDASKTYNWGRPAAVDAVTPMRDGQKIDAEKLEREKLEVSAGTYRFYVPMVTGDKEKVEKLQLWKDWAEYITFNAVTGDEISAFREKLLMALQEQGYVFASVEFPVQPWQQGFFVALVDCGPLGNITVKNEGRYYTQRQIIDKLANRENHFNYALIRNQLSDLNAGEDIKVNTVLKPAIRNGRRYIDAEVEYEDRLPIHGSLELTNTASREADSDVQLRATLQDNNLTKHNDVLSLSYMTNGDIADTLNAFYGSYIIPINELWTAGVYASWSDSEYDDVVPDLDVMGRGYAYGFQLQRELYADAFKRWTATFGWKFARTKNRLGIDSLALDLTTAAVSMPYISIGYSSLLFDKYNGRNFAMLTFTGNRADKYGASDKETYLEEGRSVDGTFFQARLVAARVQRLFAGEDAPGKWTLFARAHVLYSDDTVPNSVREYLGGFDSVRGYQESEIGGDNVISGTLELRTPLLENIIPGLTQDEEEQRENPTWWGRHRLQGVAFIDYGYVSSRDSVNAGNDGRNAHQSLLSAGLGLRLGITKYAQASVDYGLPLIRHASEDTPNHGRFHLSLQLQF